MVYKKIKSMMCEIDIEIVPRKREGILTWDENQEVNHQ